MPQTLGSNRAFEWWELRSIEVSRYSDVMPSWEDVRCGVRAIRDTAMVRAFAAIGVGSARHGVPAAARRLCVAHLLLDYQGIRCMRFSSRVTSSHVRSRCAEMSGTGRRPEAGRSCDTRSPVSRPTGRGASAVVRTKSHDRTDVAGCRGVHRDPVHTLVWDRNETLIIGHSGQNQHATREVRFLDGSIFNRLRV
jgi:hypothetical protein